MGVRRLDDDTQEPDHDRWAAGWELPADTRVVAQARAMTREALTGWRIGDPADVDDIVLMVDELVTNAIVHGRGPVHLWLRVEGRLLTGEIGDAGHRITPRGNGVPWRSEAGRGFGLVAALAHDFGVRDEPQGKTVWFSRLLSRTAPANDTPDTPDAPDTRDAGDAGETHAGSARSAIG